MYTPWDSQFHLRLHSHKPGEYTETRRRTRENDDDPYIQLYFRPVVPASSFSIHCSRHVDTLNGLTPVAPTV